MNNNYQNNNFQQNENQNQNQNQNQQAGQGFVMQPSPAAGQQGFQDQQNFQNSAPNPDPNAAPGMNPDGTPAPENAPAPKKPRKKMPLWLNRTIFAVLIAALAVGGGYAGTSLAYQQVDRVVVQRVETQTGDASSGETTSGTALSAEQVAAQCEPSVVAIVTERMTTSNFWYGTQVSSGAGSGVIISEDGYILTCDHVIEGADTVQVQTSDGTVYDATVVGQYPENDIAVIKIDATGLSAATIADSDSVVQGEQVYAIGNPEGRFSGSITDGLISAVNRNITMEMTVYRDETGDSSDNGSSGSYGSYWDYFFGGGSTTDNNTYTIQTTINVFQTSAPVSPGNSGGGLFNDQGQLIGIVNAKSSDTDAEGLGFAIPVNRAMEIASALITDGEYIPPEGEDSGNTDDGGSTVQQTTNRAVLGITVQAFTGQQAAQQGLSAAGVYIVEVTEQSTADAGLQAGDRIISIDDTIITTMDDVSNYLADKNPGDVVTVSLEREGRMVSAEVTLLENPNVASSSEESSGE